MTEEQQAPSVQENLVGDLTDPGAFAKDKIATAAIAA
jgi:hypothetical protein